MIMSEFLKLRQKFSFTIRANRLRSVLTSKAHSSVPVGMATRGKTSSEISQIVSI